MTLLRSRMLQLLRLLIPLALLFVACIRLLRSCFLRLLACHLLFLLLVQFLRSSLTRLRLPLAYLPEVVRPVAARPPLPLVAGEASAFGASRNRLLPPDLIFGFGACPLFCPFPGCLCYLLLSSFAVTSGCLGRFGAFVP